MPVVSTRSLMPVSLALLWLVAPAFAEGDVASELPGWSPPKASDEMDRIVLKSDETLYGDFEGTRNRKVYFDSAEFDNSPHFGALARHSDLCANRKY